MNTWNIPYNPPPWINKPFPIFALSRIFILINTIYFLMITVSLKTSLKEYLVSEEGFLLTSIILLFILFLFSIYTLLWEVKKTLYIHWCFWQADLLTQWVSEKQKNIYLIQSLIISHDPLIISKFHNENKTNQDDYNKGLIDLEKENVTGEDRVISIFNKLISSIDKESIDKKGVSFIINSLSEQSDYVKNRITSLLNDLDINVNLFFETNPNYTEQLNEIINKEEKTFIFSINYYSINIKEDDELASLLVFSPNKNEKSLKLFRPMPFSMEEIGKNIETIRFIQQQENKEIQFVNFIDIDKNNASDIFFTLRSHKETQLSFEEHAQGYFFNDNIGDYKSLSIYHFLALINLSRHQHDSQYLFFKSNDSVYCQTIGIKEKYIDNYYKNIPNQPVPIGTLLISFFVFLSIIIYHLFYQINFDNRNAIIASIVFIFITLLISLIKKLYINLCWKSCFLQSLNEKWRNS